MPNLTTLHLSGVNMYGSLTDDISLGSSLVDLSLSHNYLTGSMPNQFFEHRWSNLDLGFNKLSGVLPNDMLVPSTATVSLQVNRLSGYLPRLINNASTVNVLDGNLFDCDASHPLPDKDGKSKTYSCGSTSFESSGYAALAVLGFGICAISALYYFSSQQTGCYRRRRFRRNCKVLRFSQAYLRFFHCCVGVVVAGHVADVYITA